MKLSKQRLRLLRAIDSATRARPFLYTTVNRTERRQIDSMAAIGLVLSFDIFSDNFGYGDGVPAAKLAPLGKLVLELVNRIEELEGKD